MGRIQEQSEPRMRGQQRAQVGDAPITPLIIKKREKTIEKETSRKDSKLPGGEEKATPSRDRRNWSASEEIALVKCLLEHKAEGRAIPLQSKTATYWTELITLLYPGDDGITQRRLYDKVRRMHHRFNECRHVLEQKKNNILNPHESALFELLEKLFADTESAPKTPQSAIKQQPKATNGNSVKVLQVYDSSSEDEEEDDQEEQRVAAAKPTPKPTPGAATTSAPLEESSSEEEDEDDSSPEKKRAVPSGPSGSRVEASRVLAEEATRTALLNREGNARASGKLISKLAEGNERKEKKDRLQNGGNLERRVKGRVDHGRVDVEVVQSLKAELFQYVQDLRRDCMQQLDEVRSQLINPARLKLARRRQELILEELSLQEKELEIGRRYCLLQKEALKLQNST